MAALCTNSHVMLELHYAVPGAGAVLVPLNIRLSVDELAWMLEHSGARVLIATQELTEIAREAAERAQLDVLEAGADGDYERRGGAHLCLRRIDAAEIWEAICHARRHSPGRCAHRPER